MQCDRKQPNNPAIRYRLEVLSSEYNPHVEIIANERQMVAQSRSLPRLTFAKAVKLLTRSQIRHTFNF